MARKLRLEYSGAIYHLMNCGDRREPIFGDDFDRQHFLDTLAEACAKTDWQVHAYCLMSNHFHLVVETPQANLVAGMISEDPGLACSLAARGPGAGRDAHCTRHCGRPAAV